MSPINTTDFDSIPEISIQIFRFKLFHKEVFALLETKTQVTPFQIFMDRLNANEDFEACKKSLLNNLIVNKNPHFPKNSLVDERAVHMYLGSQFSDMLNKIEEEYKIISRDNKINEITKNG